MDIAVDFGGQGAFEDFKIILYYGKLNTYTEGECNEPPRNHHNSSGYQLMVHLLSSIQPSPHPLSPWIILE